MNAPLVQVAGVSKTYGRTARRTGRAGPAVHALRDTSLLVERGEVVAVVGESGAGKSTLGRIIMGLETPDTGTVHFAGTELSALDARARRAARRRMHMVFQDPYQSLHPGMRVGRIVAEPLVIARTPREGRLARVRAALSEARLTPAEDFEARHPDQLSGGQRQRVALARAFAGEPELIVADEPTSMLDASLCAGVLELLLGIRQRRGVAIVYITHDLAVARHVADRIIVMKDGQVVEDGNADSVVRQPRHPYTRLLIAAGRGRLDDVRAAEADLAPSNRPI